MSSVPEQMHGIVPKLGWTGTTQSSTNAFGAHDMLGNVWEWVQDCLNPNWRFSRAALDGSAFVEGDCSQRAYRGGSWISNQPYYLRTADRYKYAGARYNDLGFRVARSLD